MACVVRIRPMAVPSNFGFKHQDLLEGVRSDFPLYIFGNEKLSSGSYYAVALSFFPNAVTSVLVCLQLLIEMAVMIG